MSARLGVVVPCRDEERVIERKLCNLARARWPAPSAGRAHDARGDARGDARAHRLLVVDDGSCDATAARAAELLARLFPASGPVQAELVRNALAPGKCGAVATALQRLAGSVDLCVLTDADVVLEPQALLELARAFAQDERLALACGAQRFVRDLCADGTPRAADGGEAREAGDVWDRWTARVRALESRCGRLFSVHGQLLCWRAAPGLVPRPGLAADDLDLMLQARARGGRVVRVAQARFLERKTPRGPLARSQGLRRARAYFEVLRGRRAALGRALADRAQWAFYARVPRHAPELALGALGLLGAGVALVLGPRALCVLGAALALAALTPGGRRLLELARWIRIARRAAHGRASAPIQGGSDRWEMQRT